MRHIGVFVLFWHLKCEAASMLVTDVGVHIRKANRASSLSLDKMNGSFTIQKAYQSSSFRGDRFQCNVLEPSQGVKFSYVSGTKPELVLVLPSH
jgi:hypothetical protein